MSAYVSIIIWNNYRVNALSRRTQIAWMAKNKTQQKKQKLHICFHKTLISDLRTHNKQKARGQKKILHKNEHQRKIGVPLLIPYKTYFKIKMVQKFVHLFQVVKFVSIQLFIVFSHVLLYFCSNHCDFSFFISCFVYLVFFSPLPGKSSQRFVNFVYLFKEPALGLIDFVYCFLNLYFIDFLFDLYDFLSSADFRFFLFFF